MITLSVILSTTQSMESEFRTTKSCKEGTCLFIISAKDRANTSAYLAYKAKGTLSQDNLQCHCKEQQVMIQRQEQEEIISKRKKFLPFTGAVADEDIINDNCEHPVWCSLIFMWTFCALTGGSLFLHQLDNEMIDSVFSHCLQQQLVTITKFCKVLLTEWNPPTECIIECGVVPHFVEFLKTGHSMLQVHFLCFSCI